MTAGNQRRTLMPHVKGSGEEMRELEKELKQVARG